MFDNSNAKSLKQYFNLMLFFLFDFLENEICKYSESKSLSLGAVGSEIAHRVRNSFYSSRLFLTCTLKKPSANLSWHAKKRDFKTVPQFL